MSQETGPERLAQELPLQGISFDVAGTRPSTVRVESGDDPAAFFSHAIELPLHIRVAEDERSAQGTIEIEPARGPRTLVHFHPPS